MSLFVLIKLVLIKEKKCIDNQRSSRIRCYSQDGLWYLGVNILTKFHFQSPLLLLVSSLFFIARNRYALYLPYFWIFHDLFPGRGGGDFLAFGSPCHLIPLPPYCLPNCFVKKLRKSLKPFPLQGGGSYTKFPEHTLGVGGSFSLRLQVFSKEKTFTICKKSS